MPSVDEKLEILNNRMSDLEMSFTQLRLDLKSAGILHDEEYTPPPMTDILRETVKSDAVKKADEIDPFG